ncbi:MAG: DUF2892 domain-containing protein [Gemmatimonadota bacterium]
MFGVNEGNLDRGVRVVLGATLIWLGFASGAVSGAAATGLGIVGIVLVVTGVTGFCGMYKLFGINTCPRR